MTIVLNKNNKEEIINILQKVEPELFKRINTGIDFVIIDMKQKYNREGYVNKEKYPTIVEWSQVLGFHKQIEKSVWNTVESIIRKGDINLQVKKAMYRLWYMDGENYDLGDIDKPEIVHILLPIAEDIYNAKVKVLREP